MIVYGVGGREKCLGLGSEKEAGRHRWREWNRWLRMHGVGWTQRGRDGARDIE